VLLEIPRGSVSKAKICKGKYDQKLEFPERLEIQTKKPYMGGIWIFPGTEQEIKNPHILHRGVL